MSVRRNIQKLYKGFTTITTADDLSDAIEDWEEKDEEEVEFIQTHIQFMQLQTLVNIEAQLKGIRELAEEVFTEPMDDDEDAPASGTTGPSLDELDLDALVKEAEAKAKAEAKAAPKVEAGGPVEVVG